MKTTKFYRLISILLALVILTSSFTFNSFAKTTDTDTANKSSILDWFWDLFHTTSVSVGGLPEGAVPAVEKISNPFNRKSGGTNVGSFLGFYDIKATDKETGKEIHPNGEFEVRLQGVKLEKDQSVYVIHVLDTEDAIKNTPNVRFIDDAGFVSAFKNEASLTEKTTGRKGSVAVEIINNVTVDGDDIVFKTGSFSIFAIVDQGADARVKVNFYSGETLVGTSQITKNQYLIDSTCVDSIVYDPGIGRAFDDGELFRGWIKDKPNYAVEDASGALSIEGVRDAVRTALASLADATADHVVELNYYAMIFKAYTVSYLDESGVSLGNDVVLFKSGTEVDYRIHMGYIPKNQDGEFQGWQMLRREDESKVDIISTETTFTYTSGSDTVTVYKRPTEVTLKGNIKLICYVPAGFWLSFNENGKGATYTPPQFVKNGEVTEFPTPPTRFGYTFGGWYEAELDQDGKIQKDDAGNVILKDEPFEFELPLTARTDVYAKWNPVDIAKYTVIIWKEKSTDNYANNSINKNYDFDRAIVFRGQVGNTINAVSNSNTSTTDINGTYYDYRIQGIRNDNGANFSEVISYLGYHAAKYDTDKKIAPEGSTIVNVYYDRHVVRYTFYYPFGGQNNSYTPGTGSDAIYGKNEQTGQYFLLTHNSDGTWTYPSDNLDYFETTEPYAAGTDYFGKEGNRYFQIQYLDGKWVTITDTIGYYTTDSTSDGTYYIPDGNGGYIQKYLTHTGNNTWSYDTGETQWQVDNNGTYGLVNNDYIQNEYVSLIQDGNNYYYEIGTANNGQSSIAHIDSYTYYYRDFWGDFDVLQYRNRRWRTGYTGLSNYTGTIYLRYSGQRYSNAPVMATYQGKPYLYGNIPQEYTGTRYIQDYVQIEYTGTRYVLTQGSNGWPVYSLQTGLYGEPLDWPDDTGVWWYPTGSGNGGTSGTRMTYKADFLPLGSNMDVKYYGRNSNATGQIRFYTQNLTGGGYTLKMTVTANGGNFSINDKFSGFEAYQYRTSSTGAWQNVGVLNTSTGIYGSTVSYNSLLEIRFRRKSNYIAFMDGKYFNGNGEEQEELNRGELHVTQNYFYQADISSYNKGGANYYTVTADQMHQGYVFGGWYSDSECSQEYTFDTMTETGVTVYAKWVKGQYRVFLHPNAQNPADDNHSTAWNDPTFEFGQTNQQTCFRVNYGEKISGGVTVMGERQLYELIGWYTDPSCESQYSFNFDAFVLNDTTVTTLYDQTEETELDKYGEVLPGQEGVNKDASANRFWITRKLDLYAKWRYKLFGANGIDVQFVSDYGEEHGTFTGGGTLYQDDLEYTDQAHAYGAVAPTATAEDEYFKYWVVQRWDPSTEKFVDVLTNLNDTNSTVRVYPGQEFSVLAEYCRDVETNEWYHEDPSFPENNIRKHIYTFQLRAEYGPKESPEEVDVFFDANNPGVFVSTPTGFTAVNGGNQKVTKHLITNEAFSIPAAATVTNPNHKMLGWAFDKTITTQAAYDAAKAAGEAFDPETLVAADNLDRTTLNNHNNTLYAVWDINRYKVDVEKILPQTNSTYTNAYEFTFDYTIEYPTGYNRVTGVDAVSTNGNKVSVNAKNTIENIPHGSKITVTERLTTAEAAVFNVTYNIITIDPVVAEHDGDLAGTIKITNTFKSGKIKITKALSSGSATDEQFMFRITGGTLANPLTVTVKAGKSVTVAELQPGTYKVTELTDWSWRYDLDTTVTGNTVERSVVIDGGETEEVTFTNKRNDKNWLYGENAKDNAYGN